MVISFDDYQISCCSRFWRALLYHSWGWSNPRLLHHSSYGRCSIPLVILHLFSVPAQVLTIIPQKNVGRLQLHTSFRLWMNRAQCSFHFFPILIRSIFFAWKTAIEHWADIFVCLSQHQGLLPEQLSSVQNPVLSVKRWVYCRPCSFTGTSQTRSNSFSPVWTHEEMKHKTAVQNWIANKIKPAARKLLR